MCLIIESEKTKRGLSLKKRCWLNSNQNTFQLLDRNLSCKTWIQVWFYMNRKLKHKPKTFMSVHDSKRLFSSSNCSNKREVKIYPTTQTLFSFHPISRVLEVQMSSFLFCWKAEINAQNFHEDYLFNIDNFLALEFLPAHQDTQDKKKFFSNVKNFYQDDPYLFKYYRNQIYQRCILDNKVSSFIKFCHFEACRGHFLSTKTIAKILQYGFYWSTMFKDTHAFSKTCENFQKLGFISKHKESLDNLLFTLRVYLNGYVHHAIHDLWLHFHKEHARHSLGNLTKKDHVCQFLIKLDMKLIPNLQRALKLFLDIKPREDVSHNHNYLYIHMLFQKKSKKISRCLSVFQIHQCLLFQVISLYFSFLP